MHAFEAYKDYELHDTQERDVEMGPEEVFEIELGEPAEKIASYDTWDEAECKKKCDENPKCDAINMYIDELPEFYHEDGAGQAEEGPLEKHEHEHRELKEPEGDNEFVDAPPPHTDFYLDGTEKVKCDLYKNSKSFLPNLHPKKSTHEFNVVYFKGVRDHLPVKDTEEKREL